MTMDPQDEIMNSNKLLKENRKALNNKKLKTLNGVMENLRESGTIDAIRMYLQQLDSALTNEDTFNQNKRNKFF